MGWTPSRPLKCRSVPDRRRRRIVKAGPQSDVQSWASRSILRTTTTPNRARSPHSRVLQELRTRIDEIDHQFITLLAKRTRWSHRRRRGAIRRPDPRSGAEAALPAIAADSPETAASDRVIESLFQVILWASHDRQASLKAAVVQIEPRTIAIIGGRGGMGRCFDRLFTMLGHRVLVADLDTERTGVEIAAEADVVIIAVNIESTSDVIREIGPACRPGSLLIASRPSSRSPWQPCSRPAAAA